MRGSRRLSFFGLGDRRFGWCVLLGELGFGGFFLAGSLGGFLTTLLSGFLDGVERQHQGILIDRRIELQHGVERRLHHLIAGFLEIQTEVFGFLASVGEARALLEFVQALAGDRDGFVAVRHQQRPADLGVFLGGYAFDAVGKLVLAFGLSGRLLGRRGVSRSVGGEAGQDKQGGEKEEDGAHGVVKIGGLNGGRSRGLSGGLDGKLSVGGRREMVRAESAKSIQPSMQSSVLASTQSSILFLTSSYLSSRLSPSDARPRDRSGRVRA